MHRRRYITFRRSLVCQNFFSVGTGSSRNILDSRRQPFPINSSSSSPGERQSPLSSRSPPEFILDLSEMAEGWRMTAGRRRGLGFGNGRCYVGGWRSRGGGWGGAVLSLIKLWQPTALPGPQQLGLRHRMWTEPTMNPVSSICSDVWIIAHAAGHISQDGN